MHTHRKIVSGRKEVTKLKFLEHYITVFSTYVVLCTPSIPTPVPLGYARLEWKKSNVT